VECESECLFGRGFSTRVVLNYDKSSGDEVLLVRKDVRERED
jgi:hypothetical protein